MGEDRFLELEPWKGNENPSFLYTGYVDPPVWCRDLDSCTNRDQETEDVSYAMPAGHPWDHTMGQAKKCRRHEAGGEVFVEKQLKQRRLQWLGHVQRMPDHGTQKQLLRCRPQGKRRRPGGTPLHWIDLVSRDLVGVPNWQVHACVLKSAWVHVHDYHTM